MDAGLWISGHTVPVSRVQARTTISDCFANTTFSFLFTSDAASTEASFRAQLDSFLGHLSGLEVTVDAKKTVGSFLAVEKATDLFGKENLESRHTVSEDDDKYTIVCNIGDVESNSSIEITISLVSELSPHSAGHLRFTIPAIRWLEAKGEPSYELDVDIDVNLSVEASISSPSHPNTTITQTGNHTHVHLASEEKNEDFLLNISPSTSWSSCIVERGDSERSEDKYAVALFFFAKDDTAASNVRVDWGSSDANQIPQEIPHSKLVTLYSYLEVLTPLTLNYKHNTP